MSSMEAATLDTMMPDEETACIDYSVRTEEGLEPSSSGASREARAPEGDQGQSQRMGPYQCINVNFVFVEKSHRCI